MTRKICYEELFDKFKTAATEWLKETPEARSLFLVVDWEVGRTDFPPAHMASAEPPTDSSIVASMSQVLKLLDSLSNLHHRQLNSTESVIRKAEELIKSQNEKATN